MRTPIDWTGNGCIDPIDIGISASLGDVDEEADAAESSNIDIGHGGSGSGCLTAIAVLSLPVALLLFFASP